MLENLLQKLLEEYQYKFKQTEKDKFQLELTENISITLILDDKELYLYSPLTQNPQKNREKIYTTLMKANLLGEGTGNTVIGIDNNENFLTLTYKMAYEDEYNKFKETIENFANYLLFWETQIKNLEQEQSIY